MDFNEIIINVVCTIIGALIGSGITIKVMSKKIKQIQKGGINSNLNQSGRDTIING